MSEYSPIDQLSIPASADDFTVEWVQTVVTPHFPNAKVDAVEVGEIDFGTSTRIRLSIGYAGESGGAPRRLFIKSRFGNQFGDLFELSGIYAAEVRFYLDILPGLDVKTPRCFAARVGDDGTFVLVLEDPEGVDWGQFDKPLAATQALSVVKEMAAFHSTFWTSPRLDNMDWIQSPVEGPQAAAIELFADFAAEQLATGEVYGVPVPASLQDPDNVADGVKALMRHNASGESTLLHGDPHLKNLGFQGEVPIIVDWQVLRKGRWAHDVSYFLATSLNIDDRRIHERAIVEGYLDIIRSKGIEIDTDRAWLEYRAQPLYGLLVWLATPPEMQPAEVVEAFSTRLLAAAVDLECMAAIADLTAADG